MCPSRRLIFMYFIGFRNELVVLIPSVQIYTTPNIIPGLEYFGEMLILSLAYTNMVWY